jgi:hypothetical protein
MSSLPNSSNARSIIAVQWRSSLMSPAIRTALRSAFSTQVQVSRASLSSSGI